MQTSTTAVSSTENDNGAAENAYELSVQADEWRGQPSSWNKASKSSISPHLQKMKQPRLYSSLASEFRV